MKILIYDVETTGLDPKKDSIIEVAAVILDLKNKIISSQRSGLIYAKTNPEAEKITGITQEMLDGVKNNHCDIFSFIHFMANSSDCVVAHNASFDKNFTEEKNQIFKRKDGKILEWVCSCYELNYDLQLENKKLTTIANALNLDSAGAHRAMADVMMLANIFLKIDNIEEQIKKILSDRLKPAYKIISLAPFEKKEDVKRAGFRWDGTLKLWWKSVRAADEDELFDIISVFNFDVKITT